MVNQKLCIDSEKLIKKILVTVGNILHGVDAVFFKLFFSTCAYAPKIRKRSVIPKLLPVKLFIKHAYKISRVLCRNVKGNLCQIHVCAYSAGGTYSKCTRYVIHYCYRKLLGVKLIKLKIGCHVKKCFVNGVYVYVVFGNIFEIYGVNLCSIVDIKLHSRCCLYI